MKPGPAMLASITSGSAPSSATSNSASERGLVPAGLASTIAALVATSPCAGSRGGSTLMARRSSPSGRLPLATRQSSAAAIWSEKRLNRVTYLAYLGRSAEHTSELQSLMRISYAIFCLHKQTPTHLLTYENTY